MPSDLFLKCFFDGCRFLRSALRSPAPVGLASGCWSATFPGIDSDCPSVSVGLPALFTPLHARPDAGDVAMLLLNFDANATVLVTVNVTGTSRLLWQLRSGAKATVLSKSVSLLGTGLLGLTAGGQLPELRPVAAKWRIGGLLSMPPQSIAFVVFQGSRAPACIH